MQIGPQESECSVFRKCQSCDAVERVAKATMMQPATLPSELGDVTCASASAAEESLESVAFGADRRAPEVGRRYEKATLRRKM